MGTNDLTHWVFAASTAAALVAGLLATRIRGDWLADLMPAHAAASALIALFGWEVLIYLPGTLQSYLATVAGIANPSGVADQQAFVVASAAFAAAAVAAVMGILRRRPWGIVLGIGLAVARTAMSLAAAVSLLSFAESFAPDQFGQLLATTLAQNAVPALAAIGLLLWPFRRGSTAEAPPVEEVEWTGDPSPEAGR